MIHFVIRFPLNLLFKLIIMLNTARIDPLVQSYNNFHGTHRCQTGSPYFNNPAWDRFQAVKWVKNSMIPMMAMKIWSIWQLYFTLINLVYHRWCPDGKLQLLRFFHDTKIGRPCILDHSNWGPFELLRLVDERKFWTVFLYLTMISNWQWTS